MKGSIRKRGNSWYYYFDVAKVDGKRKRIERRGGSTRKEAERALNIAITEYENSGMLLSSNNMSVSDYMDYWLNEYVKVNYEISLNNRLLFNKSQILRMEVCQTTFHVVGAIIWNLLVKQLHLR